MELSFNKEHEGKEENCNVCFDDFPTNELYHLGCYHSFCHDCWQGYIDSKLDEITEKVNIFCPGSNCSSFLRKNFILQHSSTNAKEKWEKKILEKEIKEVPNLLELYTTHSTSNGYYTKSTTKTDYFHYECLSEYDTGWGCAYRCLQMLLNNLKKRNINSNLTPSFIEPSIFEIQKQLTNVNTEGYFKITDIGTSRWIGPYEISPYLFELFGVISEVGNEVIDPNGSNLDTIKRFWSYFDRSEGEEIPSPVVIDNGIKTKNILGIRRKSSGKSDEELLDSDLLLFDPHYSENISYDDYKAFLESGSTEGISVTSGDEEELERKKIMVQLSVLWIPFSAVFESELYQVLWVK